MPNCQHVRVQLVKHGVYDYNTRKTTYVSAQWRVAKCDIPMFTEVEKQRGTCKSCNEGWEHPDNFSAPEGVPLGPIDGHRAAQYMSESGTTRLFAMPPESAT